LWRTTKIIKLFPIKLIRTPELIVFPPESLPLGVSYSEWCKRWCQWIVSIPKQVNPTKDKKGRLGGQCQDIPGVYFLCQTFESAPSVPHRHVNVPNSSSIFMPIINWISVLGGEEKNEEDLKKLAKKMIDEVARVQLLINDKPVPFNLLNFRVQSPVFSMLLPTDNIFDVEPGPTSIIVDGFWIFFQPLVTDLCLETYGACRSGVTQISVNYHLHFTRERNA
jgi:hypothetical protein